MTLRITTAIGFAGLIAGLVSCDGPTTVERTLSPSLARQIDPNAPGALSATPVVPGRIALAWSDNSRNETGFEVHRSANGSTGAFVRLGTVAANVTGYTDAALEPVMEYCYKVNAVAKTRVLGTTATTCLAPPVAPPPATVLDVTPSAGGVTLTWRDNSANETGFRLESGTTTSGPWINSGTTGANSTTAQQGAVAETAICYRVVAFNSYLDAAASNADCATPPATPTNVRANNVSSSQVQLSWADNSAVEDGYQVSRSDAGGAWVLVATLSPNSVAYSDVGLAPGSYGYRVRALNDGGFSAFSNEVAATVLPGPPQPAFNVTAHAVSSTEVAVDWVGSGGETGFRVERSTDGGATWIQIDIVEDGVYTPAYDRDRTPEERVCYRVFSGNDYGESSASEMACTSPPRAPTSLSATSAGDNQIDLTWTDNSSVEDSYLVYRYSLVHSLWLIAVLPPNSTSYSDSYWLSTGTEYTYYVVAGKDGGSSSPSNESSAATTGPPSWLQRSHPNGSVRASPLPGPRARAPRGKGRRGPS